MAREQYRKSRYNQLHGMLLEWGKGREGEGPFSNEQNTVLLPRHIVPFHPQHNEVVL